MLYNVKQFVRHISCEPCKKGLAGGYDRKLNQLVICQNYCKDVATVEKTLVHELVHMYDYCSSTIDFSNIYHLACTEVRAANLADCKNPLSSFLDGNFRLIKGHEDCVKDRANRSVRIIYGVNTAVASEAVNKVFERLKICIESFNQKEAKMPTNEGVPPAAVGELPQIPASDRLAASYTMNRMSSPSNEVTPHRVVTISFIIDYVDKKAQDGMNLYPPSVRTKIALHILNMMMLTDESFPATIQAMRNLLEADAAPILSSWAKGLVRLKKKGIAGLNDLFMSVEKIILEEPNIHQNLISRKSLAGLLLRRLFLNFDRMSFRYIDVRGFFEVSSFEMKLSKYIQSERKDEDAGNETSGMDISSDTEATPQPDETMELPNSLFCPSPVNASTASIDTTHMSSQQQGTYRGMSRKQADLFIATQSNLIQTAETHALSPKMLQKEINNILKSNPGLSEAYFLSYLNSLRMGEFSQAVDNLHTASAFAQTEEEGSQSFRYAVLNLGSLHARFGHDSEAKSSVKEAIKIGQKDKDHICLQHCLSWLIRETSDDDTVALHQRSISRCEELNLPYLASLGMLHLATKTEDLADKPEYILDLLTRSSVLNCKFNLPDLPGNSYLIRSEVWSCWGRQNMNQTLVQLLLRMNLNKDNVPYLGEPIVLGLCNMALNLENEGYREIVDSILAHCQALFPSSLSQFSKFWKITKQKILYSRHLAGGDWVKAESALANLSALQTSLEIQLWKAELNFRLGDMELTRSILTDIIDQFEKKDVPQNSSRDILVRAFILMSEIQVFSHHTGGALQYLLKAKEICEKYRMELLHAIVCLHIANNHLVLGSSKKALLLVRRCLVFLLSHGSLRDRSRGLLLCAKCRISASADLGELERRSDLLEGATQVGHARDGFLRLQDWDRVKDCLYLQARIYHSLGLTLERNMAAKEYKKFDELYPSTGPVLQLVLL